jgi:hypothetical protein
MKAGGFGQPKDPLHIYWLPKASLLPFLKKPPNSALSLGVFMAPSGGAGERGAERLFSGENRAD